MKRSIRKRFLIVCLALLIQSQGFSSPLWNIETGVNLINSQKYAEAEIGRASCRERV